MSRLFNTLIAEIKNLAICYLRTGLKGDESLEVKRKIYLLNTMLLIGASNCFVIGIISVLAGHYPHGISLLLAGASLSAPYIHMRKTGRDSYAAYHILTLFGTYLVYLFVTGGVEQTGLFWYYLYPIAALFLMGCRKGTVIMLTLFATSLGLYYLPLPLPFARAQYDNNMLLRFFVTSLSVFMLTLIYEKSRATAYKKLIKINEDFSKACRTDYLTHIYNRRGGHERLKESYHRALSKRENMAILICDIDYFKQINDRYGHEFGDHVLQKVTDTIGKTLRTKDIIARWGGEEFLIILPDTEVAVCRRVAERVREAVESLNLCYCDTKLSTTISIGGKPLTTNLNLKELLAQADTNLYQAKRTGRNRVIVN